MVSNLLCILTHISLFFVFFFRCNYYLWQRLSSSHRCGNAHSSCCLLQNISWCLIKLNKFLFSIRPGNSQQIRSVHFRNMLHDCMQRKCLLEPQLRACTHLRTAKWPFSLPRDTILRSSVRQGLKAWYTLHVPPSFASWASLAFDLFTQIKDATLKLAALSNCSKSQRDEGEESCTV